MTKPSNIAWVLAAVGGCLGIAAAYMQGGLFAALTAGSTIFMGAAGLLGYSIAPYGAAAMSKTRAVLRRVRARVTERPTMDESRQVAIGMIVTLGVAMGVLIAFARIPALQLDPPPKPMPGIKTAAATPTGSINRHVAAEKPVAPVRFCLDTPKRPPPCAGIGRR